MSVGLLYAETGRYYAQLAGGLEEFGAAELRELGAENVSTGHRALHFTATPANLYRIVYMTRLCSRVLAPLARFRCHNSKYLYNKARALPWPELLRGSRSFAIFSNVGNSKLHHSGYLTLCLKDAVVDALRDATGSRPDIDTQDPDLWLHLLVQQDEVTISMDCARGSLHKRGYRGWSVEAPMQETLAAGILRASGWEGEQPLYDPFCGSGTLLAEACMRYCRIPAGFRRGRFGFENLPDFDAGAWRAVRGACDADARRLPVGLIAGSDLDARAVEAARANLRAFARYGAIEVRHTAFDAVRLGKGTTLVCNPPYGVRLGDLAAARERMRGFGGWLRERARGSQVYVYFGDRDVIGSIGLRPVWKLPMHNADLDGRLCKYEVFERPPATGTPPDVPGSAVELPPNGQEVPGPRGDRGRPRRAARPAADVERVGRGAPPGH